MIVCLCEVGERVCYGVSEVSCAIVVEYKSVKVVELSV